MDERLENPTVNKSFQIWWISETRRLVIYLALMIFNFIPANSAKWGEMLEISIRLIKLFWPCEERQRLVLMQKKITRVCHVCVKPGSGTRMCFGPRNSKIVYQNSRLSTINTFNMIKIIVMTIEEKYLELGKKIFQSIKTNVFTTCTVGPNHPSNVL